MSRVVAVSRRAGHRFGKRPALSIRLVAGMGVEGDAHSGENVMHIHDARKDPTRRNLRQVHLIHAELFDELRAKGFAVQPGEIGENVTTSGVDLLALPEGTRLLLGDSAVVEVTGLRDPCIQIEKFQKGLMAAMLDRDADGRLIRKTGLMSIVISGGEVLPGDSIRVERPPAPHRALQPV